jgi:hypothetical protein
MKNFLKIVSVYVGAFFLAQCTCVAYILLLLKYAFICILNTGRHIRIVDRPTNTFRKAFCGLMCCSGIAIKSTRPSLFDLIYNLFLFFFINFALLVKCVTDCQFVYSIYYVFPH